MLMKYIICSKHMHAHTHMGVDHGGGQVPPEFGAGDCPPRFCHVAKF